MNLIMKRPATLIYLFILLISTSAYSYESPIKLVDRNKAAATIVYPKNDVSLYSLTADRLALYIEKQTDVRLPMAAENVKASGKINTILMDGTKDKSLLGKYGLTADLKSDRNDAYIIKALWHNNMPFIILAGNSAEGVKFAAYRLMEELDITGKNASVKPLTIETEPFFKTRVLSIGNFWQAPVEMERKYNIEAWPVEKLNKSMNMYDAFGFNGLELTDRFNEGYLLPVYGITREEWKNKVWSMADNAHLNGQKVFLRAWGNAVMEAPTIAKVEGQADIMIRNMKAFCPDLPEERKRWENEIRDHYVNNYASHIDNFIGHWADAGGCSDPKSKATIDDALRLHMEIQNAFRKINPKIETSFSFWHMTKENWRGYKDHRTVSRAGILDKDVILAQTTWALPPVPILKVIPYSEEMTKDFISDGYRVGVWNWRRADTETYRDDSGIFINVQALREYFSKLPSSAKALDWHNLERCQHGLANVVNYYVAGKLMWDPKADVNELLNSFSVKMFGQNNAPYIADAYNTMEIVRNTVTESSEAPEKLAIRCQNALKSLSKVKIDPQFRPRLELDITPQQIREDLVEALTVINAYYLSIANEIPELERAITANDKAAQEKLVNSLKKKIADWRGSIAGLYEARALEVKIRKMDSKCKCLNIPKETAFN